MGIRIILYLDNMLLMANLATEHFQTAVQLLKSLGFIVNIEKSVASPTQQIESLGFNINSCSMLLSLPTQKLTSLNSSKHMMALKEVTVRKLSQILGTMVAAHPAILKAPLHYRQLGRVKLSYLRQGYPFDHRLPTSQAIKEDLSWWVTQAHLYNGRSPLGCNNRIGCVYTYF